MNTQPDFVDITSPSFKADPYSVYARLRANSPVCRVKLPMWGEAWLVTRYGDVSALIKDARITKDPLKATVQVGGKPRRAPPKIFTPLTRNMLGMDDPDHARLKRLVQRAFTPRRVDALEARVAKASAQLIDTMAKKHRFDLIADYAMQLPVTVISDLLGVPQQDRARFARGSRAIIRAGSNQLSVLLALPGVLSFLRYLRQLIALKRRDPQDDLVSELVQAESGDILNHDELMAMIAILLSAGHETTTNLIGNGTLALLANPDQKERLRSTPKLIDTAVEELLRFEGPAAMTTPSFALEDIEIAEAVIPKGALVFGVLASANRDELVFANPDALDLARDPNRHLAFGEGGHYCVGSALARLEGRVAFTQLLDRFPDLKLSQPKDKLNWGPNSILRGLEQLPVERGQ